MTKSERRPLPARSSPDADEEVERDQHRLPEDVEEEQILGAEDADDGAGEQEHEPEVRARTLAPGADRVGDAAACTTIARPASQRPMPRKPDVVRDAELAEPRRLLLVLERAARLGEVEVGERGDPEPDFGEADDERDHSRGHSRPRQQPERERRRQRAAGSARMSPSYPSALGHGDEDEDEDGEPGGDGEHVRAHDPRLERADVAG